MSLHGMWVTKQFGTAAACFYKKGIGKRGYLLLLEKEKIQRSSSTEL